MAKKFDADKMTGTQKAAVFLMAMGEDYTKRAFERMNEREISDVVYQMSLIEQITPEMLKAVSMDFVDKFEGEAKMIVESAAFIQNVVKNTLKGKQANAILDDLEKKETG